MYKVCSWFVRHLNRCESKGKIAIVYNHDKDAYLDMKSLYGVSFPYTVMHNLIDFLCTSGKIIILKGYRNGDDFTDNVQSMIILNESCNRYIAADYEYTEDTRVQSSNVIIRETKTKNVLPIEDFDKERVMRSSDLLRKYNEILSKSRIEVNGCDIPEIWLRRIWTNDLDNGGRLYDEGQYQNKSKVARETTLIDQEETVSLDFKALHPRLLYQKEEIILDDKFDPYPKIKLKLDTKELNKFKKFYGLPSYNPVRNLTKTAMLCMLNARGQKSAKDAINFSLYRDRQKIGNRVTEGSRKYCGIPFGTDLSEIMNALEEHNKGISDYFYTGVGLGLQNVDSEIMMKVIDEVIRLQSIVIPMHDAVICKVSDKDLIYNCMREGYKLTTGNYNNCIIEEEKL
jgi:hypothetical protein